MASVKLATLIIRTVAKPISNRIKEQARQHERFRTWCVDLAQFMYRSEVKLRHNILGEPAKLIRPLSETKAIDNGANAIAEGFLFSVAAALIIGETWRTSRNQTKRRDSVDDQLEDLGTQLAELTTRVDNIVKAIETEQNEERQRNDELSRILERIVEIGLRGGWVEFTDTPVQLPRVNLAPHAHPTTIGGEGPEVSSPTISLLAKPGQDNSTALDGPLAADTKTSTSTGNPTESS